MTRKVRRGPYDMPPLLDAAIRALEDAVAESGVTFCLASVQDGVTDTVHLFGLGTEDGVLVEPDGAGWMRYEWSDD